MKHVYLDMDGVLVDFIGMTHEKAGMPIDQMTKPERKEFWQSFDPNWYFQCKPLPGYLDLVHYCVENFSSVRLLTALPYYRQDLFVECAIAKKQWAEEHLDRHLRKRIDVTFGPLAEEKQYHCIKHHPNFDLSRNILIDDNHRNIEQWDAVGGTAIFHVSNEKTLSELAKHRLR